MEQTLLFCVPVGAEGQIPAITNLPVIAPSEPFAITQELASKAVVPALPVEPSVPSTLQTEFDAPLATPAITCHAESVAVGQLRVAVLAMPHEFAPALWNRVSPDPAFDTKKSDGLPAVQSNTPISAYG